jgi:hypothetical protein
VLGLGNVNVDWPAIEMGEFAASDGRAHAPSDGDTHAGDRNRTFGVRGITGFLVWAYAYVPGRATQKGAPRDAIFRPPSCRAPRASSVVAPTPRKKTLIRRPLRYP